MEIALTYIYGIGRMRRLKILAEAKVDAGAQQRRSDSREQVRIRQVIDQDYKVEGDLRREVQQCDQAADGFGMLSRHAPSPRVAGARPANPYQCAHPQRTAQDRRGQEAGAAQGLKPCGWDLDRRSERTERRNRAEAGIAGC